MASWRNIVGYYKAYWQTALFGIAMASFFETLDLFIPYAIGQLLNLLISQEIDAPLQSLIAAIAQLLPLPKDQVGDIAILVGLLFLVAVVKSPLQPWLGMWLHWDTALRSRRDGLQHALEKILSLPLEFYDEHNSGRIASRIIRGIDNHSWTYPEIAGRLIPRLVRVLGIFGVLCFIEWKIAAILLVSFVYILSRSLRVLKKLIAQEQTVDAYSENIESRNSEIVTNIKTVKAFATEAEELARQKQRLNREFKILKYKVNRGYVKLNVWQTTFIQLCFFLVLILTLVATLQKQISLGHFVTTLTITSMAYEELDPISELSEVFARRYASLLRFHDFMDQPAGQDAACLLSFPTPIIPYSFKGKVEFRNLSFSYTPKQPILQNIDMIIEPRQTVALVGRSGAGKSTLMKLLYRYFEPDSGVILMDNQDIRTLDITDYRRRLAIVHQEIDIFNGTLLNNLTYGKPQVSFEQVQEACRIARVDEFVRVLPEGFYAFVGERGVRLSGGQRQRLGIARALLMKPDLLIFDEATSNLDYESESMIRQAMQSILGTCTTIIIAHRLSSVREADKIVVLEQGRIVEIGRHDELLQKGGLYRLLLNSFYS
jgi:ATP-binding cassette, subfamily B, bacterial